MASLGLRLLLNGDFTIAFASRLRDAGIEARHVTEVGRERAPDDEVYAWAEARGYHWFTRNVEAREWTEDSGTLSNPWPFHMPMNAERRDFESFLGDLWPRMAREDPSHFDRPGDPDRWIVS